MSNAPDWQQADPLFISRALAAAQARPSGGWYALGASAPLADGPQRFRVAGHELVGWQSEGACLVAPAACPHMGADLTCANVSKGKLICPWHGLALGPEGHGRWQPYPSHDDGVLLWVQLPEAGETASPAPILAPRPAQFLPAVIAMEAHCDPEDIVANRLDPWHGAHYHPHSFAGLELLERDVDKLTLRVSFRVVRRFAVEVICTFHSPEPRTITMTIVEGEGAGSVVETHATPLAPGRSLVIEATLATTDRLGPLTSLVTPLRGAATSLMERRAKRLWVEDIAYAERRYALRQQDGSLAGD